MAFEQQQYEKRDVFDENSAQSLFAEVSTELSKRSPKDKSSFVDCNAQPYLVALDWGQLTQNTQTAIINAGDALTQTAAKVQETLVVPATRMITDNMPSLVGIEHRTPVVPVSQPGFVVAPSVQQSVLPIAETASSATIGGRTAFNSLQTSSVQLSAEVGTKSFQIIEVPTAAATATTATTTATAESAFTAAAALRIAASVSVLIPLGIVSFQTTDALVKLEAAKNAAANFELEAQLRDGFTRKTTLAQRLQIQNKTGINAARRDMGLPPIDFENEPRQTEAVSSLTRSIKGVSKICEKLDSSSCYVPARNEMVEPESQPIIGEPSKSPLQVPEPLVIGVPAKQITILPDYPLIHENPPLIEAKLPLLSPIPPSIVSNDRLPGYIGDEPPLFGSLPVSPIRRIGDPELLFEPPAINRHKPPFARLSLYSDLESLPEETGDFHLGEFLQFIEAEIDRSQEELFGSPVVPKHEISVVSETHETPHTHSPDQLERRRDEPFEKLDPEVDWSFSKDLADIDKMSVEFVQQLQEKYRISRQSWQFSPDEANSGLDIHTSPGLNENSHLDGFISTEQDNRQFGSLSSGDAQKALDRIILRRDFRDATACYPNPDMMAFTICDSEGQPIGSLFYRDWLTELRAKKAKP